MEIKVNDLIKINDANDLSGEFIDAPWIIEAVKRAPFVVVRRDPFINNTIPVGIRGINRSQRCAATLSYSKVAEIIKPEQLAEGKLWEINKHIRSTHIFKTLEAVDRILENYKIPWGPTGSVGFELASGVQIVTEASDLDIIIRVPAFLYVEIANEITKKFASIPNKVDVQLETPKGSVALAEYARGYSSVLIRTVNGPRIVKNPWAEDENLEE